MTPEFHPEAQKELAAAVKTGIERSPDLGRELLAEVRRVVSITLRNAATRWTPRFAASTLSADEISVRSHISG